MAQNDSEFASVDDGPPGWAAAGTVYDKVTIWLHWATAILVIALWLIGRTAGYLPRGMLRLDIWSVHVLLGFTLAAVLIARIVWRVRWGRILPPAEHGLLQTIATTTHALLYILLVAVVALGIANVFAHGFPLFGTWEFARIGSDAFRRSINDWHGFVANLIAVVALAHAAAALFHHHVLGDGVLRRVWPTRPRHDDTIARRQR